MKRFGLKLLLFASIQALLFCVVLLNHDVSRERNYLAGTVPKHRRLAEITSPKLVIVGGSNVPFGIQSPALEEGLGRPVANLGLLAGEGIAYMLNEAWNAVGPGDAVLLSIEYDRLGGGFNPEAVSELIQYRPANVFALDVSHLRKVILDHGLQILGGILRRSVHFSRPILAAEPAAEAFNAWGDLVSHYTQAPRMRADEANSGNLLPDDRVYPTPEVVKLLTTFARRCHQQSIAVFFSYPPHAPKPLERDAARVAHIAAALAAIPHLTVLDSPMAQTYPPDFFFDTGYHLTRQGAEERTGRILRSMQGHSPSLPKTPARSVLLSAKALAR